MAIQMEQPTPSKRPRVKPELPPAISNNGVAGGELTTVRPLLAATIPPTLDPATEHLLLTPADGQAAESAANTASAHAPAPQSSAAPATAVPASQLEVALPDPVVEESSTNPNEAASDLTSASQASTVADVASDLTSASQAPMVADAAIETTNNDQPATPNQTSHPITEPPTTLGVLPAANRRRYAEVAAAEAKRVAEQEAAWQQARAAAEAAIAAAREQDLRELDVEIANAQRELTLGELAAESLCQELEAYLTTLAQCQARLEELKAAGDLPTPVTPAEIEALAFVQQQLTAKAILDREQTLAAKVETFEQEAQRQAALLQQTEQRSQAAAEAAHYADQRADAAEQHLALAQQQFAKEPKQFAKEPTYQAVAQTQAGAEVIVATATTTITCPRCGSVTGAEADYCQQCGKALQLRCRCGKEQSLNAQFCYHCGRNLNAASAWQRLLWQLKPSRRVVWLTIGAIAVVMVIIVVSVIVATAFHWRAQDTGQAALLPTATAMAAMIKRAGSQPPSLTSTNPAGRRTAPATSISAATRVATATVTSRPLPTSPNSNPPLTATQEAGPAPTSSQPLTPTNSPTSSQPLTPTSNPTSNHPLTPTSSPAPLLPSRNVATATMPTAPPIERTSTPTVTANPGRAVPLNPGPTPTSGQNQAATLPQPLHLKYPRLRIDTSLTIAYEVPTACPASDPQAKGKTCTTWTTDPLLAAWHEHSAPAGYRANLVINGHNWGPNWKLYNHPTPGVFANLDQAKVGDDVFVRNDNDKNYHYQVRNITDVVPDDTRLYTLITGDARLTLVTCDDRGKARHLTIAILVGEVK